MREDQTPSRTDIAIVGGGAAGLATAAFAGRLCPDRDIRVFDGAQKLGAKILISGGGRCNLTNRSVTPKDYSGGSQNTIKRVLAAFPVDRTIAYFNKLGVELREEENGKLLPASDTAKTVLASLLAELGRCGVHLHSGHRVLRINRRDDGFELETSRGIVAAGQVVLATGGRSFPKTGSDGQGLELARLLGHTLVPQTPGLVPLCLDGSMHGTLSGVSQDVELSLHVVGAKPVRAKGAMLWTHFGVSGPVALDISRHWHRAKLDGKEARLLVNFLPGEDFSSAEKRLVGLSSTQPKAVIRSVLAEMLPRRVGDAMLESLGISGATPISQLPKESRRQLVHALVEFTLPVTGSRGYAYAEVTSGGVALSEVDPATMASRVCPGLFLVGEMLDVDGRIGGYNFQWAWSSAHAAALGLQRAGR